MSQMQDLTLRNDNDNVAMFSDGDEAEQIRRNALELQKAAEEAMLAEMRAERRELASEFAKDELS